MTEESAVGLDADVRKSRLREETQVPVGRIAAVEMVGLLMDAGTERRAQHQPPARSQHSREFAYQCIGRGHVLQDFSAQHRVETAVRYRDRRGVAYVIDAAVASVA